MPVANAACLLWRWSGHGWLGSKTPHVPIGLPLVYAESYSCSRLQLLVAERLLCTKTWKAHLNAVRRGKVLFKSWSRVLSASFDLIRPAWPSCHLSFVITRACGYFVNRLVVVLYGLKLWLHRKKHRSCKRSPTVEKGARPVVMWRNWEACVGCDCTECEIWSKKRLKK